MTPKFIFDKGFLNANDKKAIKEELKWARHSEKLDIQPNVTRLIYHGRTQLRIRKNIDGVYIVQKAVNGGLTYGYNAYFVIE